MNRSGDAAKRSALRQPLVLVAAAACAGVSLDRFFPLHACAWWLASALALAAWFALWRRQRLSLASIVLCVAVAGLFGAWHHMRWRWFDASEIGLYAAETPTPACVEATVISSVRYFPAAPPDPLQPTPSRDRSRFTVFVSAVRDGQTWRAAAGEMEVTTNSPLVGVGPGDRVRVFGQLSAWAPTANPGEFDFGAHARAERRLCQMWSGAAECVTVLKPAGLASLGAALEWFRHSARQSLVTYVGSQSSLASALLLGNRESLDKRGAQAFFTTGMVHVLSISGLHVSILAAWAFFALRLDLAPRPFVLFIIGAGVIGYALLIEADAPAVRAVIAVLATCMALYLNRRRQGFNTLALAALVTLVIAPADLFRVGAQFSYLGVGVLVWLSGRRREAPEPDPLDRLIARTRPWHERALRSLGGQLGAMFVATTVIWLMITPLTLAQFHLASPAAILLSPLLAPAIAVALSSGFLVVVTAAIPPLAAMCGWVCEQSLAALQSTVIAASVFPGGHHWSVGPSQWWVAGFYVLVGAWLVLPAARPKRSWALGILAGWTAFGFGAALWDREPPALRCTFVAIGHGCSVLVELPDGRNLLYDAGRLGSPATGARLVAGVLWSRGITRLDAIVVSHADVDHFNGVPDLLDRFDVAVAYVSPVMLVDAPEAVNELIAALDRARVETREIKEGDRLVTGEGFSIKALHPPDSGIDGSDNANSIVLLIEYAGRRILLPGDLESPGLELLLEAPPIDCDVAMAPHHGSEHSNPPGFIRWCTPEHVVISRGAGRNEALESAFRGGGAMVYSTGVDGAVTVTVTADSLAVETWRQR